MLNKPENFRPKCSEWFCTPLKRGLDSVMRRLVSAKQDSKPVLAVSAIANQLVATFRNQGLSFVPATTPCSGGGLNRPADGPVMPPRMEVPRDLEDGRFVKSFCVANGNDTIDAVLDFFNQYGFVVLRDVLSQEDIQNTTNAMWSTLENEVKQFSRHDPQTWKKWRGLFGLPPGFLPRFDAQLLRNRQSTQLYELCAKIIGDSDLRVSHDRWTIFRPTKINIKAPNGANKAPNWKTRTNVHLDINPWNYSKNQTKTLKALGEMSFDNDHDFIHENNLVVDSMGKSVQGLINLCDNLEEDGGLIIVPGFHQYFDQWLNSMGESPLKDDDHSYQFPDDGQALDLAQRIPMKAGSVVVWDQRCAHGSKTNESNKVRMAQFVKFTPASHLPDEYKVRRANAVHKKLEANGFTPEVSEIGRIVFGLNDMFHQNFDSNATGLIDARGKRWTEKLPAPWVEQAFDPAGTGQYSARQISHRL